MRWVLVSIVSRGAGNQLLRERRELVHPERLESNHRAQIPYLTHQSLIELIVTGHDGDRRLAMPRLRSQRAEELETIHYRHPEVHQDGVRGMRDGVAQGIRRTHSPPNRESGDLEDPRVHLRRRFIVLDDQNSRRRCVWRWNSGISHLP